MTDETYQKHIVVDNSKGSKDTELTFEKEKVQGRYVRVTFTEATNNEWAVLREVSGTGETDNIAFNKPVKSKQCKYRSGRKSKKRLSMPLTERKIHGGVLSAEQIQKTIG